MSIKSSFTRPYVVTMQTRMTLFLTCSTKGDVRMNASVAIHFHCVEKDAMKVNGDWGCPHLLLCSTEGEKSS